MSRHTSVRKQVDSVRRALRGASPQIESLEIRQLMSVGPVLSVLSADATPITGRLIFNRIQAQNAKLGDLVHDTDTVRLINSGDAPLTIYSVSLDNLAWQLVNPPAADTVIAPNGGELDVQIQFVASKLPTVTYNETNGSYSSGGGVYNGTLTISSDDANHPIQSMAMAGYWQKDSEHSEEPSLQTIVNLLAGYTTNISAGHPSTLSQSATAPSYYGEETVAPYWMAADPTQPVEIQQLASWHTQGNMAWFSMYNKGDSADPTLLTVTLPDAGQSLYPLSYGPNNTIVPAASSFVDSGAFGFKIDNEYSDDTLNTSTGGAGHHFRFYPLRDAAGLAVPNTFIMAQDYGGTATTTANFDFQDGVFILTNVRPEIRPAVVSNLTATSIPSLGVSLQWSANTEANILGYNVYRGTSIGGSFTKLNTGLLASTSFIDSTGTAGVTYFYRVTAANQAIESYSAVITAITPAFVATTPKVPTGIAISSFSGKQITVTWNDVTGESGYKIERSPDGKNNWKQVGTTSADVTTFIDTTVAGSSTFFYRVKSYNHAGTSASTGMTSATTPLGLPGGWSSADVGNVGLPGSATATAGVYSLAASGSDIYGTSDEFQFAYTSWPNNGQIIARVTGLNASDPNAKAGVMFRDSLDPSSRSALMQIPASGGPQFDARPFYAGLTSYTIQPGGATAPYWIKIIRAGSTFTGFSSPDGIHWTVVGSTSIAMNGTVLVGLAVTSHNDGSTAAATFDHVTVGSVTAPVAPTNLIVTPALTGQMNLAWLDNSTDVTGFKIERSTDGKSFSQIGTVMADVSSYLDKGLTAGKSYYYRVRATDAGIDSAYSNVFAVTV